MSQPSLVNFSIRKPSRVRISSISVLLTFNPNRDSTRK